MVRELRADLWDFGVIEEVKNHAFIRFSGMPNIDMLAPNYTPTMTQCNYNDRPQPHLPVPLLIIQIEPSLSQQ